MTKQEFLNEFIRLGQELLVLAENSCPICKQPAIESSHNDYDWRAPHGKLNGSHDHYRCQNNHNWCPFQEQNLEYIPPLCGCNLCRLCYLKGDYEPWLQYYTKDQVDEFYQGSYEILDQMDKDYIDYGAIQCPVCNASMKTKALQAVGMCRTLKLHNHYECHRMHTWCPAKEELNGTK